MTFEMYVKSMDNIKVSDELINDTVDKMNSITETDPVRKNTTVFRAWTGIIAAVLAISLVGTAAYAYRTGLIGRIFGHSADKLMSDGNDYSAKLDNIQISCDNEDYYFEISLPYIFDEFLFYEVNFKRTDGTEIIPYNSFYENGFSYEASGNNLKLASGLNAEHASNTIGSTDDGGISVFCSLYSSGGFSEGDHIHLVLEKIFRTQNTANGSIVTDRINAEIEFDISEIPKSNKRVVEVNKPVVFSSGDSCVIKEVSVSPFCIVASAELQDNDDFDINCFVENKIILNDERIIENCEINPSFGSELKIFIVRDDMEIIMPDEIAEIHIGDLIVDCS